MILFIYLISFKNERFQIKVWVRKENSAYILKASFLRQFSEKPVVIMKVQIQMETHGISFKKSNPTLVHFSLTFPVWFLKYFLVL